MRGLELSKAYYEEFGRPMLESGFSDLMRFIAVGLVGSGSERFGFDDDISQDHDFEPGFCIFLPDESIVDRKTEFQLERAYAKLPKEFMGYSRQRVSPVGGNRCGVMRTAEFYTKAVGAPDGVLTIEQWLHIPSHALAESVNGEVFFDGLGEFSAIRERLSNMPKDVMLKRLAGNLLIMAQSGQYNFMRCLSHGEPEAARLACSEFVNAALKCAFLLHKSYMPYYKWSFRALRELDGTEEISELLSRLLVSETDDEERYDTIEAVASLMTDELQSRNLTKAICGDLEKHAYSVNDLISDSYVRNLHILEAI